MLGHLKPTSCGTNPAHKAQYQQMYCSICASLRRENSLAYSFLLNHELTLVMLAFRPYLQNAVPIRTACPAKAYLGRQDAQKHPAVDVAGKLSIVLGWVKATDWATDNPKFYKNWLKNTLQKKVQNILPALTTEAQETIAHYFWLTQTNSTDFEEVNTFTGLLSATVARAVGKETNCSEAHIDAIADLFALNGKLVSVADHLIDAEKDLVRKEYNPIFHEAKEKNTTWTEAYYGLHTRFNRLKIEIYEKLTTLQNGKVIELACAAMVRKAIQNLDKQVLKHTPYFLDLPTAQARGEFQPSYVKADCDCGAVDCGGDCCSCGTCGDCCSCCDASMLCCGSTSKVKTEEPTPQEAK